MIEQPRPPLRDVGTTPKRSTRPRIVSTSYLIIHAIAERIAWPDDPRGYVPCQEWLTTHPGAYSADALVWPDGALSVLNDDLEARYSWHAGISRGLLAWAGPPLIGGSLNHCSIGVEVVVPGRHNYASFLRAIRGDWVAGVQYRTLGWVATTWGKRFSIGRTLIAGHRQVSGDDVRGAGRGKRDPGDGFDWRRFDVYYRRYEEMLDGTHTEGSA